VTRIHDVIVVGAGPGGSAVASFLARRGVDVLLLDKSSFPREKVCGDGLTPQALYWCDRLGCIDEVLAQTSGVIRDCDLYINGERALSGGFPDAGLYPDFAVLLDRRRFDDILLRNALSNGAQFRPGCVVRSVQFGAQAAIITARTPAGTENFAGRIVIGADGVTSAVSRAIGNDLKQGVKAISVRGYFRGVKLGSAPIRVYFDRDYFPGYGWLFVDDTGFANIGVGYAADPMFPMQYGLNATFQMFLRRELGDALENATQCGAISGGASGFFKPKRIVADRVMLIGDAANQADPLNGGGIHKAMESGYLAAEAAITALTLGDFSASQLQLYERLWSQHVAADWETAEIFLSIAKNPAMKDFCLYLLGEIGRLTSGDQKFQDFCAGIFSGVISQSLVLSPIALYHAFPKDPATWRAYLAKNRDCNSTSANILRGMVASLAGAGSEASRTPLRTAEWGLDVATKVLKLANRQIPQLIH
jgi:geranylgeranyl reductase family protein